MPSDTIINLENISVYQNDMLVLSDVNLKISKGEFVYIIGRTGSGKSSLLRTLYADLPLLKGEAIVSGYNLGKIRKKEIPYFRRKLGIVFQDFQLLTDRNVADNLMFVMKATGWKDKAEMQKKLHDVLDKAGLSAKGFKKPHQLSGGEQQRLVIARALINNPDVILADEPTGNLDSETYGGIMNLLFEISKNGKAVLMATHNNELLRNFPSRTVKCHEGKIIEVPLT